MACIGTASVARWQKWSWARLQKFWLSNTRFRATNKTHTLSSRNSAPDLRFLVVDTDGLERVETHPSITKLVAGMERDRDAERSP